MVIALSLMLLGALGPIAAVQWRSGRWLGSAQWIARNSSVHVLYATPVAGVLLGCMGLSIIWPPATVLVFVVAVIFVVVLLVSPHVLGARPARQAEAVTSQPRASTVVRPSQRPSARPAQTRKDARRAS
jgi:hypothetical protein